ncbi:hypothetical protein GE09DRAFT_1187756 [Coniochaeta sp. 2T2.1]|nr:hypothetical protein GE09DRAFT_1187756 [Coniochaeta sp. 2T2.1]
MRLKPGTIAFRLCYPRQSNRDHLPLQGEDEESAGPQDEDDSEEDADEDEDEEEHVQRRHVQALWAKLCEQRDLVKQLRLELSSKRKHLRELRGRKNEADNRFMSMLRPYLLAKRGVPGPSDIIIRQIESMQQENDEYHGEETEVEQLEADLEKEELSRERLELEFFTFLYGASDGRGQQESLPPGPNVENYRPSSRASLSGIPAERPVDIHPLYKQLLDAVGDQELAKEHHVELLMYRDSILYNLQLTIRRAQLRDTEGRLDKLGPLPDNDDLELVTALAENPSRLDELQPRYRAKIGREEEEFLKQFPKEEAMLREKLTEAKNEVDRLRQLCIEKGAMRKNAPYHEEYTIFSNSGEPFPSETLSINQDQTPRREEALESSRFSILLSNPCHGLGHEPLTPRGALRAATRLPTDDPNRPHLVAEAMKEYGISTLVIESAAENKSDYINRWLLHRLRTSPLEVKHLFSVFSAKLKVRNTRRWQEDVLYYWSRDDANKPLEEYIASVTTRDALVIDDATGSEHLSSSLGNSDRPGSDPGRPESPPRSLHIAS